MCIRDRSNSIPGLQPRNPSGTWTIGSTKENVLNAVGNPTSVDGRDFIYPQGTIEFATSSSDSTVTGWSSNRVTVAPSPNNVAVFLSSLFITLE